MIMVSKKKDKAKNGFDPVITRNRRASYDYNLMDHFTAGLELKGFEIKSLRARKVNIQNGFASFSRGQVWLYNVHINPYEAAGSQKLEPTRTRRLLLKKSEIERLRGRLIEKGLTLIPLELFWRGNWVKVKLALAKGKKMFDKRAAIAKKETRREIEQSFVRRQKA